MIRGIVEGVIRGVTQGTLPGGGGVNPDMVLVMATTGAAETITIPCQNVGTFNATINWGDGEADSVITAWNDADLAHEYAVAGDQTITISGTFPNIYFNNGGDVLKLKKVTNLGATGLTRLGNAFLGATNLTSVTGYADTSGVTKLDNSFSGCTNLATISASGWDTSASTNLFKCFLNCTSLTKVDVSGWNTALVTNMQQVFGGCTSLTKVDVSGWNTALVTNMLQMFFNCIALTDAAINGWNIEAVTTFSNFMFGVTLPTSRYDATLIAWDAQNPIDSLSVHFGNSKYTDPSAAATARANLVAVDLWTISDAGPA